LIYSSLMLKTMNSYEKWNLIINALIALGLIAVLLTAIFGDWIRKKILPVKLTVKILDKNGELTILDNGHKVIYYHLRIISQKSSIVHKCRIFLKKIQKRKENGEFEDIPLSVPPRYIWTPSESSPEGVDIVLEKIIDFGYIIDNGKEFKPTVTPILNSFKGNLGQNETFRYYIETVAENYHPRKLTGIEVSWDGKWPEDLSDMYRHLQIKTLQ
jgi:hypothetical protein